MITWKNCFRVGVSALILFLFVFYFKTFTNILGTVLTALTPFFIGLIIAYLLNIIMCFYERHYFNKKADKKAEKYGCKAYYSLDEMLEKADFDVDLYIKEHKVKLCEFG
jgi:hypothetical protein